MQIRITDEATRRALLAAVWTHAARTVSETIYDMLHFEAHASLQRTGPSQVAYFTEVGDDVALLHATFHAAEKLQTVQLGEEIEIALTPADLADGLSSCAAHIAEDEAFWRASQDERDRALATFDEAQRLLREMQPEAVAS
jgi:hypothetical protein